MDSNICFEISCTVVEGIRGRCSSFSVLMATAWDIWWTDTLFYVSIIDEYALIVEWINQKLTQLLCHVK